MDREEALGLLKGGEQGVAEWNRRRESGEAIPALSDADLRGADLRGAHLYEADLRDAHLNRADLNRADLSGVHLSWADLSGADLSGAHLIGARLNRADLSGAHLYEADLSGAHLSGADLRGARLSGARLRGANLNRADLRGADLRGADLRGAHLNRADLRGAKCQATAFINLDLSEVRGLEEVQHLGPSSVSTDTLFRSGGKIPAEFLRGCGFTPWEVLSARLYSPELTPPGVSDLQYQIFDAWTKGRSMINGCFISYSRVDAGFVDKLRSHLVHEGINVWLDRHDMVSGTLEDQVWRAIQLHHVVIIVLSKDAVKSDWVENELDMAREKEKAEKRAVLCPISLDDAWEAKVAAEGNPGDPSRKLWRTLKQKLVLNFHGGEEGETFEEPFRKLVRGLNTEYQPRPDVP